MPEEVRQIYEPLKAKSQEKLFEDLYGSGAEGEGSKYKRMYEDTQKNLSVAMLKLYEAGTSLEDLMEMFNIESKKTLQNRLSKARKEAKT